MDERTCDDQRRQEPSEAWPATAQMPPMRHELERVGVILSRMLQNGELPALEEGILRGIRIPEAA